jgi:hypothetical protein
MDVSLICLRFVNNAHTMRRAQSENHFNEGTWQLRSVYACSVADSLAMRMPRQIDTKSGQRCASKDTQGQVVTNIVAFSSF